MTEERTQGEGYGPRTSVRPQHEQTPGGVAVEIRGLRKSFNGTPVLRGVDLAIESGEIMVIVGGSGEGKSVLLRHIAGLERPDAGEIRLNGLNLHDYLHLSPQHKPFRISMVFQNSALLNSLTVGENIALRLREYRTHSNAEIARIVARCLADVELAGKERTMPGDLSGGMRKRVAIARALAVAPQLILYDEPTADLDPILTEQIGALIKRIRAEHDATQIVVAHNLALAVEIGNHIAVLRGGRIVDYQPATDLGRSSNEFTQQFLRAAQLRL
jgi:phospholipid/cholesterol/gamma-HCH transport system ATP-binding protein